MGPQADEETRPVDAVLPLQPGQLLRESDRGEMAPVRPAAFDLVDDPVQPVPEVDDEAVDVAAARPAVIGIPLQHRPSTGKVFRNVVRSGRVHGRTGTLRIGGEARRDGAEEGHREPDREVGDRALQRDPERVSLRDDTCRARRSPGQDVVGAEDVLHVLHAARLFQLEDAGDLTLEARSFEWPVVAEAKVATQRERVRPAVRRHRVARRHLFDRPKAVRQRPIRVVHELRARRVEEEPGRREVGDRRVEGVDAMKRHEDGTALTDPALTGVRARHRESGNAERGAERQHDQRDPPARHVSVHTTGGRQIQPLDLTPMRRLRP